MSPYSSEELVSRDFVLNEKPKAIINIVDATNIERNLYLTMQLLEMNVPMVVALNMMDEMRGNGGTVDINRMESMLGVPVVPISAAKNQGVDELVKHAVHIAKYQEKPLRQDFCDSSDNGGAVHRCLHAVGHLIEDHATEAGLPLRFAASKIIEGDELILNQLNLDQNEKDALEHIVFQMEKERKLDRSAAMADMRFSYTQKVCDECVIKPRESKEHIRSEKTHGQMDGHPRVHSDHGPDVLSVLLPGGAVFAGPAAGGHRRFSGPDGKRHERRQRERGHPRAGAGRAV